MYFLQRDPFIERVFENATPQIQALLRQEIKANPSTSLVRMLLRGWLPEAIIQSGLLGTRKAVQEALLRFYGSIVLDGEQKNHGQGEVLPLVSENNDLEPIITATGLEIYALTTRGGRPHKANQDRVGVHKGLDRAVVVDGIGGSSDGGGAAQIVAEEILNPAREIHEIDSIILARIQNELVSNSGACFAAMEATLDKNGLWRLNGYQNGDCRVSVYDHNLILQGESVDEDMATFLVNQGMISEFDALTHALKNLITSSFNDQDGTMTHYGPYTNLQAGSLGIAFSDGTQNAVSIQEFVAEYNKKNRDMSSTLQWLSDAIQRRQTEWGTCIEDDDHYRFYKNNGYFEYGNYDANSFKNWKKNGVFQDGFRGLPSLDNASAVIIKIT